MTYERWVDFKYTWRLMTIALTFAMAGQAPLCAQDTTLELDPSAAHIEFTLPATMHTVHGTFLLKGGTIQFNPQTGSASGQVLVDVTSGNTGNERRDRKMHKEILETQQYPEAKFTPRAISGKLASVGSSDVEVSGTLTLHGSDHPVTMPAHVEISANNVSLNTHFEVPYVAWGIKNPSTVFLHVGEKATVDIIAAGHLVPPPQQATKGDQ